MAFSDLAQTTLASTINSSVTTVPGVSSSKFDTGGGYLNIDNELLSYAAISGNSFTGCVRGLGSPVATTASGHNSGAIVTGVVVATQLTALTPPSFATPAIALSTAAAAGAAATVIRSDGTIAAFDATVPTSSAVGDSAAAGSAAVAARRDHAHGREAFGSAPPAIAASGATGSATTEARSDHVHAGLGQSLGLTGATQATRYAGATTSGAPVSGTFAVGDFVIDRTGSAWVCTAAGTPGTWTQVSGSTSFATPAILLAAAAAAGAASTAIRSDATIAAFDATAPTTSNPGDAAAVGSVAFAAHRDHLHGREATAAPVSDGSRAYNSTTVSTASSTETAVTMDSERSDSAAFHSTSTNTSRMTIPTGKAGRYTVAGTVEWAASALGTVRRLSIRLNGATFIAKNEITSILNVVLPQEVSTVYDLAVGDYVELMAFQDTVGAVLLNASGNYSPEFTLSAGGAGGATAQQFNEIAAAVLVNATSTGDAGSRADHFSGSSLNAAYVQGGTAPASIAVAYDVCAIMPGAAFGTQLRPFTPTGDFRVEARMLCRRGDSASGSYGGLVVSASTSVLTTSVIAQISNSVAYAIENNTTDKGHYPSTGSSSIASGWVYLRIDRVSGTINVYYSQTRTGWTLIATWAKTITVAALGWQYAQDIVEIDLIDVVS